MGGRLIGGLTLLSALACGVVGGTFFGFSSFVMRSLAELPAAQGIAAMQSINTVILRTAFIPLMLGTAALCLLLGGAAVWRWRQPGSAWEFGASVLYLCGVIAVTMLFNVPRNDALSALAPEAAGAARVWSDYVAGWTAWNHVRAACAVAAAAAFTLALGRMQTVAQ